MSVRDFDPTSKTLRILGKGRSTQAETIDLGSATVQAIADWLEERKSCSHDSPLFIALDSAHSGHRLSGDAIPKIVVRHSKKASIKKQMSPHRIQHSVIMAALDATDGNVRKVQKFSRYRNLNTLMIYDDNRGRDHRDVTDLLDLLQKSENTLKPSASIGVASARYLRLLYDSKISARGLLNEIF